MMSRWTEISSPYRRTKFVTTAEPGALFKALNRSLKLRFSKSEIKLPCGRVPGLEQPL